MSLSSQAGLIQRWATEIGLCRLREDGFEAATHVLWVRTAHQRHFKDLARSVQHAADRLRSSCSRAPGQFGQIIPAEGVATVAATVTRRHELTAPAQCAWCPQTLCLVSRSSSSRSGCHLERTHGHRHAREHHISGRSASAPPLRYRRAARLMAGKTRLFLRKTRTLLHCRSENRAPSRAELRSWPRLVRILEQAR